MPCHRASPCALCGLALGALLLAGLWNQSHTQSPAPDPLTRSPVDLESQAQVRGLWMRYESRAEGEALRFWYFHGDGKGLYRYGRVGLAHTHSFDYRVEEGALQLHFRKRGEDHQTPIELDLDDHGDTWLRMGDDPREPGARYRRVDSELDWAASWSALAPEPEPDDARASSLGDRIWIDYRHYATGGAGFQMYQLAGAAIDGRGVGWFHHGDFDDWTTESLTYRVHGEELELFFDLREEPNSTAFSLREGPQGRELLLQSDPRDFWGMHRYADGGRSFGSQAFAVILGMEPQLHRLGESR